MSELLPCPWCGDKATFRYDADPCYPVSIADSHVEPCPLGFHELQISYPTEEIAAEAWNTRAPDPRITQLEADKAFWKGIAQERAGSMVQLNLDRAAMGVENMQLREALERIKAIPTKEWSIDTAHAIARGALSRIGGEA